MPMFRVSDRSSGHRSPFATTSTLTLRTEAEHRSSSLFCPPLLSHRSSRYRNAGPSTSSRSVPRLTPVGLAWSRKSSGAISYHAAVNWPAARTRFSSSLRTRSTSPPITGAHAGLTRPARTLPSRVIRAEIVGSSGTTEVYTLSIRFQSQNTFSTNPTRTRGLK